MARHVGPRASMRVWKKPAEPGACARSHRARRRARARQPRRRSGDPSAIKGEFHDSGARTVENEKTDEAPGSRASANGEKARPSFGGECWASDSANAGSKNGLGSMQELASSSHSAEIASAACHSSNAAMASRSAAHGEDRRLRPHVRGTITSVRRSKSAPVVPCAEMCRNGTGRREVTMLPVNVQELRPHCKKPPAFAGGSAFMLNARWPRASSDGGDDAPQRREQIAEQRLRPRDRQQLVEQSVDAER